MHYAALRGRHRQPFRPEGVLAHPYNGRVRLMRIAVEQLPTIFDALDYQVVMYDRDWRYAYVNRHAARVSGRDSSALIGQSAWTVSPDAVGSPYYDDLHRAAATGLAIHGAEHAVPFGRRAEVYAYPFPEGVLVFSRESIPGARPDADADVEWDAMLGLAQQAAGIGVFEWDAVGRVVRGSPAFFEVLARPALDSTISLHDWAMLLHPADRDAMAVHLERALDGREPVAHDYRIVMPDGQTRWVQCAAQLHVTASGERRVVGTMVDISARKQAEDDLRRSDERYRAFVATSSEGIWRCELAKAVPVSWPADQQIAAFFEHGLLAECNDAMAQMYGFDGAEQLLGARLADLLPPDVPANQDYLRRFVSSGYRLTGQESHEVDRHGRPKVFRNSLIGIVEDGGITRAWGTQTDITDVKMAQEREAFIGRASAALASSLDYRHTLSLVADLAVSFLTESCAFELFGTDGAIERVAAAYREPAAMTSLAEECSPRPAPLRILLAEVRRTQQPRLIRQQSLTVETDESGLLADLRALGVTSMIVAPLVARSRVLGAVVLASHGSGRDYDATDVRVAADLAHRAAMAIDNARLFEEAQDANRAKDDFLARLSHELRTPLNAVLGWTLMLRGIADPARVDRGLDVIDRNGRALTRIIEDLLDFSRNVRSGLRFEPTAIDLRDVAQQAVTSIEPVAQQNDVRLTMSADLPCMVTGDAARLQQVAWNLLTNAVKFTPPGGTVSVTVGADAYGVEMRVADTGQGIRPELLDVIFDPFRQGDAHGTPGLGLGLAIVRQIVQVHGGTVDAENRVDGGGALFTVRLPLSRT